MKALLVDLVLRYAGRPGVAMGGGISLPEHVGQCPENAVFVSANEHGALLRPVEFIVSIDDNESALREYGVPVIGRRHWCDYRIQDWIDFHYSGPTAAWVLWALGCHPIVLAGMDCYQGGTYHHDAEARSTGNLHKLSEHLEYWLALREHLPDAMIRSCGGPTREVFSAWDPAEPVLPCERRPDLEDMKSMEIRRVRTQELARINHKRVPAGLVLPVSPAEYTELMSRRTAVAL